jgi:hypothetical protein
MAARNAIWKRLSQVRLDDVSYDIRAQQHEDGRFTVAWVCLRCCEQGPPIPADEFLERATSFAQIGVRAHHELVHADARRHFGFDEASPPRDKRGDGLRGTRDDCHAAYQHLRTAFENLCTAHAQLREFAAPNLDTSNTRREFATACRTWNESACEFDAALKDYSDELSKREQAIGDIRQPFTAG